MLVLNVNKKVWGDSDVSDKQQLLELSPLDKRGFLAYRKDNGKKEKVLLSLDLWEDVKDEDLALLRMIHWDVLRIPNRVLVKTGQTGLQSSKTIVKVEYKEKNVLNGLKNLNTELRLEEGYSNLKEADELCRKYPKMRLNGGKLLTLPTLEIRVGRKDVSKCRFFPLDDGKYDDIRDLMFPEGLENIERLVKEPKEKSGRGTSRGRKKIGTAKKKLGARKSGVRGF